MFKEKFIYKIPIIGKIKRTNDIETELHVMKIRNMSREWEQHIKRVKRINNSING